MRYITCHAVTVQTKCCSACGQDQPRSEFHKDGRAKDGYTNKCKDCRRLYDQVRYVQNKERIRSRVNARQIKIVADNRDKLTKLLEHAECVDCGIADPQVLEFDHVRGEKRRNVSDMMWHATWETVQAEIDKCEVVCANCHRKRTSNRGGHWRTEHFGDN